MSRGTKAQVEENLTKIYNIIIAYVKAQGYPPTVRELMDDMNMSSTATIKFYLDRLEERNLIRKTSTKSRAIEIVKEDEEEVDYIVKRVPVLGEVAAGKPIFAFENYDEVYEMSDNIFDTNGDIFILVVKGDSMINAGIKDKDKIVVRRQNYANNNDIVVAMINGSATVKRFFKEEFTIRLQPENDMMKPIFSREVVVLGKVVGLMRNL